MQRVYYSSLESDLLGPIYLASTEKGICAIDFNLSERAFTRKLKKDFPCEIVKDDRKNRKALSQLREYLHGELMEFDLALDLRGTRFQRKVWSVLREIPYGETRSYKDVAKAVGLPKAYRAVGGANGANPVPIVVPCHRVVESNGGLGGYGQGLRLKRKLLEFEKAHGPAKRERKLKERGGSSPSKPRT